MCFIMCLGGFSFSVVFKLLDGIQTSENGLYSAVILRTSPNTVIACRTLNIKNKVCGAYFIHDSFAILTASV